MSLHFAAGSEARRSVIYIGLARIARGLTGHSEISPRRSGYHLSSGASCLLLARGPLEARAAAPVARAMFPMLLAVLVAGVSAQTCYLSTSSYRYNYQNNPPATSGSTSFSPTPCAAGSTCGPTNRITTSNFYTVDPAGYNAGDADATVRSHGCGATDSTGIRHLRARRRHGQRLLSVDDSHDQHGIQYARRRVQHD